MIHSHPKQWLIRVATLQEGTSRMTPCFKIIIPGFLSTGPTLWASSIILSWGVGGGCCPVHCRKPGGIRGLYISGVSSTQVLQSKMPPTEDLRIKPSFPFFSWINVLKLPKLTKWRDKYNARGWKGKHSRPFCTTSQNHILCLLFLQLYFMAIALVLKLTPLPKTL